MSRRILCAMFVAGPMTGLAADIDYRLRILPTPTPWVSTFRSDCIRINEAQIVLGSAYVGPSGSIRHFIAGSTSAVELPMLSTFDGWTCYGLSNSGLVCGSAWTNATQMSTAWVQNGDHIELLNADQFCSALNINSSGHVVGIRNPTSGVSVPVMWRNGSMMDLDRAGRERGWAIDINDQGTAIGYVYDAGYKNRKACIWRDGVLTGPDIAGTTFGLSENGTVLAGGTYQGVSSIMVIRGMDVERVPGLPSPELYKQYNAVNDRGMLIASSSDDLPSIPGRSHGWLYRDGAWSDLNDHLPASTLSRYEIRGAGDINNSGVIATWILDKQLGQYVAGVMEPVPEPGTWLALGIGCLAVIRRRRTRG